MRNQDITKIAIPATATPAAIPPVAATLSALLLAPTSTAVDNSSGTDRVAVTIDDVVGAEADDDVVLIEGVAVIIADIVGAKSDDDVVGTKSDVGATLTTVLDVINTIEEAGAVLR